MCSTQIFARLPHTTHTHTHQQCTTQTASVKEITRYEEVCGRKRDELVAAADEAASERGLRERSAGDEPGRQRDVNVATFAPGRDVWGDSVLSRQPPLLV
jgi:hypothetical protein